MKDPLVMKTSQDEKRLALRGDVQALESWIMEEVSELRSAYNSGEHIPMYLELFDIASLMISGCKQHEQTDKFFYYVLERGDATEFINYTVDLFKKITFQQKVDVYILWLKKQILTVRQSSRINYVDLMCEVMELRNLQKWSHPVFGSDELKDWDWQTIALISDAVVIPLFVGDEVVFSNKDIVKYEPLQSNG